MWLWLFVAPWCVFALWWMVRALGAAKTVKQESLASTLSHRIFFLAGGLLLALAPHSLSYPLWHPSFELAVGALILEVASIAFAIWAREHLGKLWSGRVTLKEGHHLVDTGPYRLARHPIYTGILFGIGAVVMVRGTLSAVLALALFVIGVVSKILTEEELMLKQFGEQYRDYRKRVRALIPFVV